MTMTRDQLRAARILLHIEQPELAERAKMGVATLRRFESGHKVGEIYVDALQREIERAGAVLIQGSLSGTEGSAVGIGVALRPAHELPPETLARMTPKPKRTKTSKKDAAPGSQQDTDAAAKKGRATNKKERSKPSDVQPDPADDGRPARRGRSKSDAAP